MRMKMKTFLVIFLVALSAASAQAEVCFSNWQEYTAVRSQLPPALQTNGGALNFGFGNPASGIAGIMKISKAGSSFNIDSVVRAFGVSEKSATVRKACYSAPTLKVTFTNGKTESISVTGSSLIVKGFKLGPISSRQYADAKQVFLGGTKGQVASMTGGKVGGK